MALIALRLRRRVVCLTPGSDHASSLAAGEIVTYEGEVPRKPPALVTVLHNGRQLQVPSAELLDSGEVIHPEEC